MVFRLLDEMFQTSDNYLQDFFKLKLSSTAKVARWFQQLPWHTASLSRPESGFVSGDSRSEKFHEDQQYFCAKDTDDLCDEFLLVEGSSTIWTKLSAKKRRKLLGMRLVSLLPLHIPKRGKFNDLHKAVVDRPQNCGSQMLPVADNR
uniref:Uncharacterized protein n=1 Tax=Glossina palpalis gambiensis TaxID=67801 RepID=A0A1B0C665_9MUSC